MKKIKWEISLGIILIIFSIIFYLIHYLIFRDAHHIFIFLIGDIAFVFIEVLLVTIIIHELLNRREKNERMEKLKMVIGTYFSEMGFRLLDYISAFDPNINSIIDKLVVTNKWTAKEFDNMKTLLKNYNYQYNISHQNIKYLKELFSGNREFLLRLLENPTLHEHETFTDLLWAVTHLIEELSARHRIEKLPDTDIEHLRGDIVRVYKLLAIEWLDYMKHLKNNYPYLFSLAMRTNPFDNNASPVVI